MAFFETITNEWEQAHGYTVKREFATVGNVVTAYVYVQHDGQQIGIFDAAISEAASAEARAFIAEDYASRRAAEADAQAELDDLLDDHAGLSYEVAASLNVARLLGATLTTMTDRDIQATARHIAARNPAKPWADVYQKLINLRDDDAAEIRTAAAAHLAEAASESAQAVKDLAEAGRAGAAAGAAMREAFLSIPGVTPTTPAQQAQWITLEPTLTGYFARCPYCGRCLEMYAIRIGQPYRVTEACEHACVVSLSAKQAEFANPGRYQNGNTGSVKILDAPPAPKPEPAKQGVLPPGSWGAVARSLAERLGIDLRVYNRGQANIYQVTPAQAEIMLTALAAYEAERSARIDAEADELPF